MTSHPTDGARVRVTDVPPLLGEPWAVRQGDGRPFSKDPSVVRFGDRYLMYVSLAPPSVSERPEGRDEPGFTGGWHIGVAESADLRDWQVVGRVVPDDDAPPEEAQGMAAPGAVVIDGVVHLFYQSYGNGPRDAICHATSTDGVTFTRDPSNPVFRPMGSWSCGRAIDADAIVHGDRVLLAWATRDPEMTVQMVGVAEAPLGSPYGRDDWRDLSVDGPALPPELDWERECIEAPALVRRGETLVMFYAGGYNNEPQQIGWATSTDGVAWTRGSDQPFLANGAPGEWNSSESGHPGVLTDAGPDGSTYLFFQGNDTGGRTWSIAGVEVVWDGLTPSIRGLSRDGTTTGP